jgi:hypothetical protein
MAGILTTGFVYFDGLKYTITPINTTLTGIAGGDLLGSYPNPSVVKLQGYPISATPPTINQVLEWNGSEYVPTTISTSSGPFEQPGGIGTIIEPFDETASFQVSGGDASGAQSQSFGSTAALDPNDFAAGYGSSAGTGTGSGAGNNTALSGGNAGSPIGGDVAIGSYNNAIGGNSACLGGSNNTCNSQYSSCVGGFYNTADASYSICLGGSDSIANAQYSVVMGRGVTSIAGTHEGSLVLGILYDSVNLNATTAIGFTVGGIANNPSDNSVVLINAITGSSITIPSGASDGIGARIEVKGIAIYPDTPLAAEWTYRILITCRMGTTSIIGSTGGSYTPEISTGGAAANWTLVPSASGNYINLTFTSVGTTSIPISCVAQLDVMLN